MPDLIPAVASAPDVLSEIRAGGGQTLSAAGHQFPGHRRNGTVDPSTVFRWVTKGMRTQDGRVVRLEAVRVGGRWLTSGGAVARFVQALTDAAHPSSIPAAPARSSNAREKANAAAVAALAARGA